MAWLTSILLLSVATMPLSEAFNVDESNVQVYSGHAPDYFGYKVLQYSSGGSKGIIISSPLRQNRSGGIKILSRDQTFKWFCPDDVPEASLPEAAAVKLVGLSMAVDSSGSRFTVCGPSVEHQCHENSYLNGICYDLTVALQEVSSFTPAFQKCTKKTVDLVFLFDGSNSMSTLEFDKNKDFILDIMDKVKNSSIKFAAVQFSSIYRKVFDFDDYLAGRAEEKLKAEPHMKGLTNTHTALTFILNEVLENPSAGATPDATKVLVLITDGNPSDEDTLNITQEYDAKNVIRFVIGVKDAKLEKFKAIASEPKEQNAFKIQNYNGLTGVLENFQKKIFNVEGSTAARAGNLIQEMSQSGFSLASYQDTFILGSVGTNNWRGSLLERRSEKETQMEDPGMKMDSYMGYSVSAGRRSDEVVYFTGAPRFQHTGQVVLFRHHGGTWTAAQRTTGDQIGSYFGAELCSVDVNSDGDTDFLLVGAPHFYQPQDKKEGRVYVYQLTEELQLKSVMNVAAPSLGRFGSTISSLADINGDGLRDVAVGAPMEDDNRGVVYVYLGERRQAIHSTYSQRIMGETVSPGSRFFGLAISGVLDLGEDDLPDLVVGSQGAAIVLRSRPVLSVGAHLWFHPAEISVEALDCLGQDQVLPMVDLTVCFHMAEVTRSRDGGAGLNITYTLAVDPKRQRNRGFFLEAENKSRNLTSSSELTEEETCYNHSIYMEECVFDTMSPVAIKLSFVQTAGAGASLNEDSVKQSAVEVPFEKQCRNNESCVAELQLDVSFMTAALLVAEENYFNMSVTLENLGDDSYNTSLTLLYPPGLSFSMMTLAKASRTTLHSCKDLQGVLDRTVCGISLPVYRSRTSATFNTSFLILIDSDWNDTVTMTVQAKSDNTNSSVTVTQSVPVQFEVQMVLTVKEESVTYLNFTSEQPEPKKLLLTYRVDNVGFQDFPVGVSLSFPTKLQHNFQMSNYEVVVEQNKTRCTRRKNLKNQYCPVEHQCVSIECETFNLQKTSAVDFSLSGDVFFKDLRQLAENASFLKRYTGDGGEVKFFSVLQVHYDNQTFVLDRSRPQGGPEPADSRNNAPTVKQIEVRVEFIIPPNQRLIILTGTGLGFLFLIIVSVVMFKLGCFKRRTPEYYEEQEEGAEPQTTEVQHKAEQQSLLSDGGANGSSPPVDSVNHQD